MVAEYKLNPIINAPADVIFETLSANLERSSWHLSYSDGFTLDTGQDIRQLFGITSAFAGAGLKALLDHGAHHIPFFVKIESVDLERSDVLIIAAGSQSVTKSDHGRREKVASKLLELCTQEPRSTGLGDMLDGLFGRGDGKKKKR